MQHFRNWMIQKVADWLFSPPKSKRKKAVRFFSGFDDESCFYTNDHVITWEKEPNKLSV